MTELPKLLTKERIKKAWDVCCTGFMAITPICVVFAVMAGLLSVMKAKGGDLTNLIILFSTTMICGVIIWAVLRLEQKKHYLVFFYDSNKFTLTEVSKDD